MIIKHPRLIIKQHGTIKNYRYVGDVSVTSRGNKIKGKTEDLLKSRLSLVKKWGMSGSITWWNNSQEPSRISQGSKI